MARGLINVDTVRLDSVADQVDRLADTYESEYGSMFGIVNDMQNVWAGEDNTAFTNQIEGFRDDFQRMAKLMRDYAAYLRKAAAAYRETQDTVASDAKNLSQGS